MVGSIICGVDEPASAQGAARVARGLPESRARDLSNDALLRWEWEGGTPGSASEPARVKPAENTDIRSQPPNRSQRTRRVEVREVVVPAGPPAESRRPHV
jgi:hypothetical protein